MDRTVHTQKANVQKHIKGKEKNKSERKKELKEAAYEYYKSFKKISKS